MAGYRIMPPRWSLRRSPPQQGGGVLHPGDEAETAATGSPEPGDGSRPEPGTWVLTPSGPGKLMAYAGTKARVEMDFTYLVDFPADAVRPMPRGGVR